MIFWKIRVLFYLCFLIPIVVGCLSKNQCHSKSVTVLATEDCEPHFDDVDMDIEFDGFQLAGDTTLCCFSIDTKVKVVRNEEHIRLLTINTDDLNKKHLKQYEKNLARQEQKQSRFLKFTFNQNKYSHSIRSDIPEGLHTMFLCGDGITMEEHEKQLIRFNIRMEENHNKILQTLDKLLIEDSNSLYKLISEMNSIIIPPVPSIIADKHKWMNIILEIQLGEFKKILKYQGDMFFCFRRITENELSELVKSGLNNKFIQEHLAIDLCETHELSTKVVLANFGDERTKKVGKGIKDPTGIEHIISDSYGGKVQFYLLNPMTAVSGDLHSKIQTKILDEQIVDPELKMISSIDIKSALIALEFPGYSFCNNKDGAIEILQKIYNIEWLSKNFRALIEGLIEILTR